VQGQEAKQVPFAGYDMGALNISHPQQVNEGLMLNTPERLIQKGQADAHNMESAPNIIRILQGLLEYTNCIDIDSALHMEGPRYGGT
jgi:N-dimethylarginine dimethylaminohydrolase